MGDGYYWVARRDEWLLALWLLVLVRHCLATHKSLLLPGYCLATVQATSWLVGGSRRSL